MGFFDTLFHGSSKYVREDEPTEAQKAAIEQGKQQYPGGAYILDADGMVWVKDGKGAYYRRTQNARQSPHVGRLR